ncbi:MAG: hypothetical protein ACXVID_10830 [Thermoanaerobaculia bacterium]
MRALAILCVVPGFSLGLIAGATHLVGPLEPSAQRTNLVWSNRVFTTRKDFETWLTARGSNYELWSQRHPVAARHFDVASRSLASTAAENSRRRSESNAALLITIISCSVLLAMLALPKLVRFARFLLDPPSTGLRPRGPPLTALAAIASRSVKGARTPRWTHTPTRPRSALLPDVRFDWRSGWTALDLANRSNSRVARHYLPKVVFYATAVVLSFAIGACVAIYLG